MRTRSDGSAAPSNAVVTILFVLGRGSLHGYGIMKEVEDRTGGEVSLLPSSLYATIKRMLDDGLIEESDEPDPEPSPGRPRRMYRITEDGRDLASREVRRMAAMIGLARGAGIDGQEPAADGHAG